MEISRDNDQKRKESPYMEMSITMTKNEEYKSNNAQLLNHSLSFVFTNHSFFSATSVLYHSPMLNTTTASLDKLTCTNYVDLGKCQDKFGRFSWSNYLNVKLEVFERDDNRDFCLVQNLTMR